MSRTKQLKFGALALVVAGVGANVVGLMTAHAAVINDPVTSITVTPSNPRLNDPVRTDIVWCIPDSATAGDTFSVSLPPQLTQLPNGFGLRDPDGVLVANATIAGTPAVATFTFNDYVDTHNNVCGTAFFESRLDASLVPGTSYTLTYVVNGTTTFQPVITVLPAGVPAGRTTAKKGAFFSDTTDECRTVADACIAWYVESQLGPFQSVTVTDDGLADATFNCDRLTVTLWSVDASGNLAQAFSPASQGTTVQSTCTTTAFQVVATNIPSARLLRVVIRATPAQLNPLGGVTFQNSATVAHTSNGVVDTDDVVGVRRSALVGGDASGVILPPTTTAAPPVTEPATTTTVVAALPPVPGAVPPSSAGGPVLPATGSNYTLVYLGIALLIGGASLMVVARRRETHPRRA